MSNKVAIFGLGSMGKRRIRCLQALGRTEISGYDIRADRQEEAREKYSISLIPEGDNPDLNSFSAVFVCTPPDRHNEYLKLAIRQEVPAFCEASVVLNDVREIFRLNRGKVFIAPSCTLKFHPLIAHLKEIVKSRTYGRVTNFTYHCGQYLPDWHPWEQVSDYYVSNPLTGAAREIVPFELTWLTDLLGFPEEIIGRPMKTMDVGADIPDSYPILLKYRDWTGIMMVDVVSRFATRSLILNFERAQLRWNWEDEQLHIFDPEMQAWKQEGSLVKRAAEGYNENIPEEMYIREIEAFFEGIQDPKKFPNTLEDDIRVLELLTQTEKTEIG
jgi:predicted dehydrogenase